MEALERRLNLKAIVVISLAAMLGPGIFVLPGVAVMYAGSQLWLAYLLALVCVVPASLAIGELGTAIPTSGGAYVYIERTFGPLMGTLAGFGLWLALLFKSAFALMGIGAYLVVLVDLPTRETALVLLGCILFLNMFGMGKMSEIISVVVMVALVSLSLLGVWTFMRPETLSLPSGSPPEDLSSLLLATATVVVSYAGALKIGAVAGEVKNPHQNLPKSIFYSLLIAAGLYVLVACAYIQIPYLMSEKDLAPIHTLTEHVAGKHFGFVMCAVAIFTMVSMANAGVLAASRFPFAMSRDKLLMPIFGHISPRYLTPIPAILLSCLTVAGIILFFNVEKLAKFASVFQILIFVVLNVTVMVLRETRVQWYKPGFAIPMYPWMPLIGIISGCLFLMSLNQYMIYALASVVLPGALTYFLYSRKRVDRKGVLGFRGTRKDLISGESSWEKERRFESLLTNAYKNASVVVCLFGKERGPDTLIELGVAVSKKERLEVVHLTEIPEQIQSHDIRDSASVRSLRRRVQTLSQMNQASIVFDPISSHDLYATVYEISQRLHCSWLIHEWGGKHFGTFTVHNQMGWVAQHLGCHLITFRDAGIRYFRNILVVMDENHIKPLTTQLAYDIANIHESDEITLFCGYTDPQAQPELESQVYPLVQADSQANTTVLVENVTDLISRSLVLSEEFDLLLFLCADDSRAWWEKFFSEKSDILMAGSACSVICLREARPLKVTDHGLIS